MPANLPLTTYISTSSSKTRMNRTLHAQFGDGYSQDAPDGTNYIYDTWNVVYSNLTQTDRDTLWGVLNSVGSWDYLNWQAPGDSVSKKWKITTDGISETTQANNIYNVSFKVKQVF